MTRLRKLDAEPVRLGDEEPVRDLDQDAGAVAGVDLASAGAAVLEVEQDLQPVFDDIRGLTAPHVDDEADATGIVLVTWVIETLGTGTVNRGHFKLPFRGLWRRPLVMEVMDFPEIEANGSL